MNNAYEKIPDESNNGFLYKGVCTFEDIMTLPDFDFNTVPELDTEALSGLRKTLGDFEIIVFIGTWCEDSQLLIPQLYHVLNATNYPISRIQMFGVDRGKQSLHGASEAYNILFVPTIILMKDGKEQGRITEQVQQSVELDLVNIIR
jgi:thiol-disulfide isomerase/thioredoxin